MKWTWAKSGSWLGQFRKLGGEQFHTLFHVLLDRTSRILRTALIRQISMFKNTFQASRINPSRGPMNLIS
jgi:hypothetical protein